MTICHCDRALPPSPPPTPTTQPPIITAHKVQPLARLLALSLSAVGGNKQEVSRAPHCSDICRDGDPPTSPQPSYTPPRRRSGICQSDSGAQLWWGRGRIRPLLCPSHLPMPPHPLPPTIHPLTARPSVGSAPIRIMLFILVSGVGVGGYKVCKSWMESGGLWCAIPPLA